MGELLPGRMRINNDIFATTFAAKLDQQEGLLAMRISSILSISVVFVFVIAANGQELGTRPRSTPLTRLEMKQALEDMKEITPRIPLPLMTEDEKSKLDERSRSYEGRLRALYLPWTVSNSRPLGGNAGSAAPAAPLGQNQDPKMTLDYAFKTELFWIVSRANNCHY